MHVFYISQLWFCRPMGGLFPNFNENVGRKAKKCPLYACFFCLVFVSSVWWVEVYLGWKVAKSRKPVVGRKGLSVAAQSVTTAPETEAEAQASTEESFSETTEDAVPAVLTPKKVTPRVKDIMKVSVHTLCVFLSKGEWSLNIHSLHQSAQILCIPNLLHVFFKHWENSIASITEENLGHYNKKNSYRLAGQPDRVEEWKLSHLLLHSSCLSKSSADLNLEPLALLLLSDNFVWN